MRTAIFGTGFIAGVHKKSMLELGGTLALVVGHTVEKARAFAEGTDAVCADALEEYMLELFDCAIICTPPSAHVETVEKCLKAGKHVLCEKPLCLDTHQAKYLAELAEKSNAITGVNFNNRFYPSVNIMKDELKNADQPLLVSGHYFQQYHVMPVGYSWRYKDPLRATSEIGSHILDLVRYTTGKEIVSLNSQFLILQEERVLKDGMLYAAGEGEKVLVSSDDAAAITMRLSDGGLASIIISEISPGRVNELTLEVSTTEGAISWNGEDPHKLCRGVKTGMSVQDDGLPGGFIDTFVYAIRAFYDSVNTNVRDPRLCTFRDAYINVALCNAIYESAHNDGKCIRMK